MSEKTEVQDKIFNRLIKLDATVQRTNGGRRGNIPFYFWKARYRDNYGPLDTVLQSAFDFCAELRRDLLLRPKTLGKGVSDLSGTLPGGRAYYIECKAPGQLLKWSSQEQALYLLEQHARGAAVGVFDNPGGLDEWIKEMSR